MPELPTQKVIAALKRSNSNIEAATVDLLDAAFLGEDVNTSYDTVDLSDDRDISVPVVEDSNSNNNKVPSNIIISQRADVVLVDPTSPRARSSRFA